LRSARAADCSSPLAAISLFISGCALRRIPYLRKIRFTFAVAARLMRRTLVRWLAVILIFCV
jgi:hypothetical protein